MALKWVLLATAALVASTSAQSLTTVMPNPAPTSAPPMVPATSTPMPTVSAEEIRRSHFYCRTEVNQTREDFRSVTYRWGLWIQYPVLSYLDTIRKRHLFYVISNMVAQTPGVDPIFNDICIAEVEHYGVSTYDESVFVKLYVTFSGANNDRATLQTLDDAFRAEYGRAGSPYTRTFLGQIAINVNATDPSAGPNLSSRTVNDSVHPDCTNCPEGDPTLLAVVVGTYVGVAYIGEGREAEEVTIENLKEGITGYRPLAEFVNNPRPINYGLEAGDIVFAVFGSIFLTILAGAIVLGFVIHPFFLS